jgi:raffinose/stachyose/melibiose transport system substrate-binding protein
MALSRILPVTVVASLLVAIYVEREGVRGAGPRREAAGDDGAATAAGGTAASGKRRLRVMTHWMRPYRDAFDELLEEWSRASGVEAVQEAVPPTGTANLTDMVKLQMAAGDPPDLFMQPTGTWASPFIDGGRVRALDAEYARRGWGDRFVPWAVKAISRHGKIWGVPFSSRAVAFWYRKDLFAQLGLEVPQSYAELEALCRKAVAAGKACLSLGGMFGWSTMRLFDYLIEVKAGPERHDALNALAAPWDGPEAVAAYQTLQRWVNDKWIAPGFLILSPYDARLPFYRGTAVMVLEGDWFETVAKDDEQPIDRFDFFLPPTGHEPMRFSAFPQQLMLTAGAKSPEAALDFLDYYTRPDVQRRYFERLSLSTATLGVHPPAERWPAQKRFRGLIDRAVTYLPTDQLLQAELMDAWFQVQDGLVAGQLEPAPAGRRVQETVLAWKQKEQAKLATHAGNPKGGPTGVPPGAATRGTP